jgi:superfamily I DNA and/or RNA helicase
VASAVHGCSPGEHDLWSFPYLFRHLGKEAIGWLLIDEAGQATPQAAVGPLWRSKRAVVVGDPLQLEPIVQLPKSVEQILRSEHGIETTYLPKDPSVQTLADQIAPAGTYRGDGENRIWVGIPLNVHRRCEEPMFSIVNAVAYENQMINCTPERSDFSHQESHWIDIPSGAATGNWIPAEGEALKELLDGLRYQMADFKQVFLITPFRHVATQIRKHAKTYQGITAGTIHTAQGREADIVILVLGGNPNHPRARAWAAEKPNLLNVAVSRARRRLYVIGDREAWSKLPHFETLTAALEPLSTLA